MIVGKEEFDDNPWNILSIYELQYFNCPSCGFIEKSKQTFVDHTLKCHPEAKPYLFNICDGSLDDVDWIKEEEIKEHEVKVEHLDDEPVYDEPIQNEVPNEIVKAKRNETVPGPDTKTRLKFKCNFCEKRFQSYSYLAIHMLEVHEENYQSIPSTVNDPLKNQAITNLHQKCEICNDTLPGRKDLVYHYLKFHVRKCAVCLQSFEDVLQLAKHLDEEHDTITQACYTCNLIFKGNKDKNEHIRESNCQEGYRCPKCGKDSKDFHTLQKHIHGVHSQTVRCDQCDKTYRSEDLLNQHISQVHEGQAKKLICDICSKGFNRKYALDNHIKRIHEKKLNFKCDQCMKKFFREIELKQHVRYVHENVTDFQCDICGKGLISKPSLQEHLEGVHQKQKTFKCTDCEKIFYLASALNTHRRKIHGELKFPCKLCSKSFTTNAFLKHHVKSFHEGIKRHFCHQCNKGFYQNSNLTIHIKTVHQGIKEFKCLICTKEFVRKKYLENHIKESHSDQNV